MTPPKPRSSIMDVSEARQDLLNQKEGLWVLKDRVFRIGHLGDMNDLMLVGTLGGVEMGFALAGVPCKQGGIMAAMEYLATI